LAWFLDLKLVEPTASVIDFYATCRGATNGIGEAGAVRYFVGLADSQLEGNRDFADDESAGNRFLSSLGRYRGRSDIQSPPAQVRADNEIHLTRKNP
jgi:hypothetical protein